MTIELAEKLLQHEGISYELVTDLPTLLAASGGRINPANARGIRPAGDDVILFTIYDAVDWINRKGLRRCS